MLFFFFKKVAVELNFKKIYIKIIAEDHEIQLIICKCLEKLLNYLIWRYDF
jgi:hypothetical protein